MVDDRVGALYRHYSFIDHNRVVDSWVVAHNTVDCSQRGCSYLFHHSLPHWDCTQQLLGFLLVAVTGMHCKDT